MGNKAILRSMELHDLEELMVIEYENFTSPWFREHYEYELLENPFAKMTVLTLNDELIGYLGLWTLFEEAQVTTIAIKKSHQRQGYGEQLIRAAIHQAKEAHCEQISLEVRVSNIAAQNLYRKYGFEIINTRPQYYEDNHEDAYLMMKGI